jgi:hypothetical protein
MRILELFCGTKSISKVFAGERGWDVVSVDIDSRFNPDIITDILTWDYKDIYNPGDFDVVWASPPCRTFSTLRRTCVGRIGYSLTKEIIERDIHEIGLPLVRKAEEIIAYLKPRVWYMENPYEGRLKDFITIKPIVASYCMYGFPYRKHTAIWTNSTTFAPMRCGHKGRHEARIGMFDSSTKLQRYAIPPELCRAIADDVEKS